MNRALLDYFRCPHELVRFELSGELSGNAGFFQLGDAGICYGQYAGAAPSRGIEHKLLDAASAVKLEQEFVRLPFDFSQVIDNLRYERYQLNSRPSLEQITAGRGFRKIYYSIRPILPIAVRKYLQRASLSGWDKIIFPRWPVDFTVEFLMEYALTLMLKAQGINRVPFIWFWPEGAPSCAIMTHDVEAEAGRIFCDELMNMDDSFGVKSAFQIIPEVRYETGKTFLERFHTRGFEINVHDLNHDGSLFHDKQEFSRRATEINRYAKDFGTRGFRSGAMYRKQEWFGAFDLSYDMSVPNVAHLEPQRGGCCTVMPYFIGDILELPLTTTQDYSLFHILGDYSIDLWKQQISMISERHGLISFIAHPDYLIEKRARGVYLDLLAHLSRLRAEKKLWITLPSEVDRWWRARSQMTLVRRGNDWDIEGPEHSRARLAYAVLNGDRLHYELAGVPAQEGVSP